MNQDRFHRLWLIRSPNIGPVSYKHLLTRFGSAVAAVQALPNLTMRNGAKYQLADKCEIEREIDSVDAFGGRYILLGDGDYPELLTHFDGAPVAMIARGNVSLLKKPCVAMVGARNASAAACRFTKKLAWDLSDAGVVVVSGLARGIDTAAHWGAIDGGTVGVIGTGLDVYFPKDNQALQDRIATDGLLLTEHAPHTQPLARHFPARNRIIAGLATATLVVEAAPNSGSLITARLANDAGRDVMAVPGSPLDPRAQGCNQLIRNGATLIQNADDVLENIRSFIGGQQSQIEIVAPDLFENASADHVDASTCHEKIISLLGSTAVSVDEIVRQSGFASSYVQTVLMDLELADRLQRHAGGQVSLR